MDALALMIDLGLTLMNGFGITPYFSVFAGLVLVPIVVRVVIQRFSQRK